LQVPKLDIQISQKIVTYPEAIAAMEQRVYAIQQISANELLWLLEHPHLFTTGTSGQKSDILNPSCPVYESGRGGQVTYHGPGQSVIYVLLDLSKRDQDVRKYVGDLEQWLINALQRVGVKAVRCPGRVGIWVDNQKIASIGVRVKKWVTLHGVAVNINPDLNYFNDIVPCGIKDYGVSSLAKLQDKPLEVNCLDEILCEEFMKLFGKE
jgi:lipoyl(octanoyl) transferase